MKPVERDIAYLWDMREAAKLVTSFLQDISYVSFCKDELRKSAVERQLEIFGEAARRISNEFQNHHPEIPWRNIIGLRNILAHEYGDIKIDRIWLIATSNLLDIIEKLDILISPYENNDK